MTANVGSKTTCCCRRRRHANSQCFSIAGSARTPHGNDAKTKRAKGTGWRHIHDTLHDEILTLKLQPGQLLDEITPAERFRMSQSLVREALIWLAGGDLVVTLQKIQNSWISTGVPRNSST